MDGSNSNSKNENLSNLNKITEPVTIDIINSWVSKMSLCMLLLAASILFYRVDSGIIIPLIYRKICSISLIFLTCFISIFATVEFNTTITEVIDNYKNITHLYSYSMVILAKNCYVFVAVIYILTCVFIAYLIIIFKKK